MQVHELQIQLFLHKNMLQIKFLLTSSNGRTDVDSARNAFLVNFAIQQMGFESMWDATNTFRQVSTTQNINVLL